MRELAMPLTLILNLALTACAVGPDYVRPDVPAPAHFARADAPPPADGEMPVAGTVVSEADAEFWRGFEDPLLTRLVDQALAANHDLRIALARYDSANALLREAKFDRFPTVTAGATASHGHAGQTQALGIAPDGDAYGVSARAAWELDLFGRVRRNIEAQRADTAAAASDLDALQIAIVGEVARTYVELRGVQERLRVAQANADNQRETLRLVDTRFSAGRGTEFDTSRARAQLEATLARVPALDAVAAVDMHRLAVLTGQTPDALIAELAAAAPLPGLPGRIDAGTPGDLLRRRPDVIAAEHRLQSATARIGVATADLFPRFTLSGLIGTQAVDTSALFESSSETHLVALGVDWSFLDVGRVRARIAATGANASAALAGYEQAVLLALEDTENSLVRLARARDEDGHLERAALDSATAAGLARVRFEAGAIDLLDVLDAERSQLQAQDAFADGRTRTATAAIGVYEALAGGWPARVPLREQVGAR